MKKNYTLDMILFIAGLVCILTGIVLDFHLFSGGREAKMFITNIHIYTGYTMAIGLLFHLAWHMGWIKNVTRLIFGSKNTKSSEA